MQIRYCPGKSNILADALSRLYESTPQVAAVAGIETTSMQDERLALFHAAHTVGHHGHRHMVKTVQDWGYNWLSIYNSAEKYLVHCPVCLRNNPVRKVPRGKWASAVADAPIDHWCIDLRTMPVDASGNWYALVIMNVATRFVVLRALPNKTASFVGQALSRSV